MVHFPGFARTRLWIHRAVVRVHRTGFPHSEIPGSKPVCGSPRLIAACHVLHRLLLPRHPPCALSSLTTKFTRLTRIHIRMTGKFYDLSIRSSPASPPTLVGIRRHQRISKALIKSYSVMHLYLPNAIQLSNIVPRLVGGDLPGQAGKDSARSSAPHAKARQPSKAAAMASNLKQNSQPRFGFEVLVELTGIEPVTPCLQSRCSPS